MLWSDKVGVDGVSGPGGVFEVDGVFGQFVSTPAVSVCSGSSVSFSADS